MRYVFPPLVILLALLCLACAKDEPVAVTSTAVTPPPASSTESAPSPTPTATATPAPVTIEIVGTPEFQTWTQAALDLLEAKAPEAYAEVLASIRVIEAAESGSGIFVQEQRFRVGQSTAYAPDHPREQQLIWYAGAIVHDAHHSALFAEKQPHAGKEAEIACLTEQKAALLKIETNSYFSGYVQSLIDGADDPVNQYWTQANRHW